VIQPLLDLFCLLQTALSRLVSPSIRELGSKKIIGSAIVQMMAVSLRILLGALLTLSCAGCGTVVPEPTASSVSDQPSAASPHEEMRDLTAAEKSILADGFAAGLDDPDSVKFRWAQVPKSLSGHAFEYCGLINVKNGTSGYSGMKPFLATITTENGNITGGAIAALNSDNLEENRDVIPKLCRQKGLNPFDAK
jgi:hypothetical protein